MRGADPVVHPGPAPRLPASGVRARPGSGGDSKAFPRLRRGADGQIGHARSFGVVTRSRCDPRRPRNVVGAHESRPAHGSHLLCDRGRDGSATARSNRPHRSPTARRRPAVQPMARRTRPRRRRFASSRSSATSTGTRTATWVDGASWTATSTGSSGTMSSHAVRSSGGHSAPSPEASASRQRPHSSRPSSERAGSPARRRSRSPPRHSRRHRGSWFGEEKAAVRDRTAALQSALIGWTRAPACRRGSCAVRSPGCSEPARCRAALRRSRCCSGRPCRRSGSPS